MSRKEEIAELYRVILKREPDDNGLNHYMNSALSIEEIEIRIAESEEYAELHNNFNNVEDLTKPSVSKNIIYQDDNLCIDYYQHSTQSKDLVFSVNGLSQTDFDLSNLGLYGKRLLNLKYDTIFFKTTQEDFYQSITPEIIDKIKTSITRTYDKRIAISQCMGAYLTVMASKDLHLDRAIMFAPWREGHYQNLFDLNKNTIAPECKYYIACNYNNDRDKRDFDYFCNVLPKNNTIKIRVDDRPSIHHIAYTLRENGVFSEFCKQILNTGTVIENPLIIIDKE